MNVDKICSMDRDRVRSIYTPVTLGRMSRIELGGNVMVNCSIQRMLVLVDRTGTHMYRVVFGNSEVNFEITYDGGINLSSAAGYYTGIPYQVFPSTGH
jgi:hypothetical protein